MCNNCPPGMSRLEQAAKTALPGSPVNCRSKDAGLPVQPDDLIGPAHLEGPEPVTAEFFAKRLEEMGIAHFPKPPIRETILDDAKQAVCQDRNAEYGEPIDNLSRWAKAANALGYRGPAGRDLKPHDMAVLMGLGKLARSVESAGKADTWIDLAGYAAIGYECVTLEDQ